MQGKITVTQADALKVHTTTAPKKGWQVNSHTIELRSMAVWRSSDSV